MKNAVTETKHTPEGVSRRLDEAEDRIGDREGKVVKNTQSETATRGKGKTFKEDDSWRGLWENAKHNDIHIAGAEEGDERQSDPEAVTETLPKLAKATDTQAQEAQSPTQMNPRRPTPRHSGTKTPKVNDKGRSYK